MAERKDIDRIADESDAPQGLAAMIGTRNLLIIIVTMPFVFFLAIFVIVSIFGSPLDNDGDRKTSRGAVHSTPIEVSDADSVSGQRATLVMPAASGAAIALPEDAEAGAISLDGDQLAVRIDSDEGSAIVIYDLTQSRVVQTVPLVRSAAVKESTSNTRTVTRTEPRTETRPTARVVSTPVEEEPSRVPQRVISEEIKTPVEEIEQKIESQTAQAAEAVNSGLTLAAPGFTPEEATPLTVAETPVDDETLSDVDASRPIPPTPGLGPRRTRYVTTPE